MKNKLEIKEINELISNGLSENLFMLSEARQDMSVVHIVDKIIESKKRIILLAGPSSSGKTTTAKKIALHLHAADVVPLYLGMDDYFVDRENLKRGADGKPNLDVPEAVDIPLFNKQLSELLAGKEVDIPEFDFVTGKKTFGKRKTILADNHVVVIEGIHALNDILTADISEKDKFKIFVAPQSKWIEDDGQELDPNDIRKIRRIVRDYNKRGWSVEGTFDLWQNVRDGEEKYIFPFKKYADAIFDSTLPYELAVLKKYAYPLLDAVPLDNKYYSEARRLISILDLFESIDDRKIEEDSIIREFIGGSSMENK